MSLTTHKMKEYRDFDEDFKKWMFKNNPVESSLNIRFVLKILIGLYWIRWDRFPFKYKWADYQKFFNENQIYISIIPHFYLRAKDGICFRVGFHYIHHHLIDSYFLRQENDSNEFIEYPSTEEAMQAAINEAITLYENHNVRH